MPELLRATGITAAYGSGPAILDGASLNLEEGQIHCVIGANGAGKSTLLRVISGLLQPRSGEITFKGKRLNGLRPHEILRLGICFVPQERALFPKMSVRENLRMGGYVLDDKVELERRIGAVLERFPILEERAKQKAGSLSGGQQQILAMARALVTKPEVVMLDEPSLGLAPLVVQEMFEIIRMLRDQGMSLILVEQNAVKGLENSDWGSVLELGKTLFDGPADQILNDPRIQELYLGRSRSAA